MQSVPRGTFCDYEFVRAGVCVCCRELALPVGVRAEKIASSESSHHPPFPKPGKGGAARYIGLGLGSVEQGLIGSANNDCEFGFCGSSQPSIPGVSGFSPGLVLAGVGGETICIILKPCGAGELIFGGLFIGTVAAIDTYHYAKEHRKEHERARNRSTPIRDQVARQQKTGNTPSLSRERRPDPKT